MVADGYSASGRNFFEDDGRRGRASPIESESRQAGIRCTHKEVVGADGVVVHRAGQHRTPSPAGLCSGFLQHCQAHIQRDGDHLLPRDSGKRRRRERL